MIHRCTRSRGEFASYLRAEKYQNLTAMGIASNDLHQNGRLADHLIRGGDGDFAEKSSQTKPCEAQAVLAHGPPRDLQRAGGRNE
jgi:hypothetical protein